MPDSRQFTSANSLHTYSLYSRSMNETQSVHTEIRSTQNVVVHMPDQ